MMVLLLLLLHPNLNPLRVDKVVMRVVHTVHCIREELCMGTSRDRRAADNKQRANEQIASGLDRMGSELKNWGEGGIPCLTNQPLGRGVAVEAVSTWLDLFVLFFFFCGHGVIIFDHPLMTPLLPLWGTYLCLF